MNLELDRRTFLKRTGQVGGLVMAGGILEAILAACGGNVTTTSTTGQIANAGLKTPGLLQWGATSAGGAPYVFADPSNPNKLVGFEVDIADAIAKLMGVTQKQIENDYSQLEQALLADKFDMVMNGWEITDDRKKTELFSDPYYRYGQQIVVRKDDTRFSQYDTTSNLSLKNLENLRVGTGASYKAADILATDKLITLVTYDPNLPFDDLTQKKIDAVLIDGPIVSYYVLGSGPGGTPNPALKPIGKPFQTDDYIVGFNKSNSNAATLLSEINQAFAQLKKNNQTHPTHQKWSMWNDQQPADIN